MLRKHICVEKRHLRKPETVMCKWRAIPLFRNYVYQKMFKIEDKVYQYLIHFYDRPIFELFSNFVRQSEIYTRDSSIGGRTTVFFLVDPELYKQLGKEIDNIKKIVANERDKMTGLKVMMVYAQPDLRKFQIIKNNYTTVQTPWEQINNDQNHLLNLLRSANNSVDFQNIGNTSRTLLQYISNIVFDPNRHIPDVEGIDLSKGKFKNRLHTYIKC